ncbi:MAG TPA: peptide ABC transporter substrate-binding protein [Roseiflexaceae bacterium]|nr:peptide ABC transporter substrate-binding protein [Roseiflexaceae bacterium]
MLKRVQLRSSFALMLLLALVLPILSACGGTGGEAPAAATSAPAAGEAATAAPAAGEAATAAPAANSGTSSGSSSAVPGTLRMAIGSEPDNMDPQKASFVGEIQFIMMNWQALMTFDKDMKPIPGAAESVEPSADGKTYTFKLRANSKYSDGSPLTAKNFEYAWKRVADPRTGGEYQFIGCDIIQGYNEFAANVCQGKSMTETMALNLDQLRDQMGVKAIDDNTLEVKLVNPAPYFLSIAALWVGVPTREQDAQDETNLATAVPANYIGNGPFKLTDHQPDVSATFEKNENYQGPLGPVKLDKITIRVIKESQIAFQAYQNGELDINGVAPEDLSTVQGDATLSKQVIDMPNNCTFYLGFNNAKPPFDNIKVRQAFAQAVDREAWVRDVQQGLGAPTQSFIPEGMPGYMKSDQWAFDPAKAKQTLADAGFANGQGLPPIKLTFSSSARNKVRFEFLANQFKQNLGIDAQLDPVDPTAYTALTKDPETVPQMFYLGWCADFPDPQNWLTAVFKTGGSSAARIGFSNADYDKLVSEADMEQDPQKRAELYDQAQKLLIDQAPVAFIASQNSNSNKVLVKPYVKGISSDTVTALDYIPGFFNLANIEVAP